MAQSYKIIVSTTDSTPTRFRYNQKWFLITAIIDIWGERKKRWPRERVLYWVTSGRRVFVICYDETENQWYRFRELK